MRMASWRKQGESWIQALFCITQNAPTMIQREYARKLGNMINWGINNKDTARVLRWYVWHKGTRHDFTFKWSNIIIRVRGRMRFSNTQMVMFVCFKRLDNEDRPTLPHELQRLISSYLD